MNIRLHQRLNQRLSQLPLQGTLAALLSVIAVRVCLEIFSDNSTPDLAQYLHYILFYLTAFAGMSLLYHVFLRHRELSHTLKLLCFGMAVIILPPLLDLLISGGQGYDMGYIQPESWADFWLQYLTYWKGLAVRYVTPGIRIEILLMVLFTAWYIGSERQSLLRGVVAGLAVYTLMFVLFAFPYLMWQLYNLAGIEISASPQGLTVSYLAVLLPLTLLLARAWDPQAARVFIRDLRLPRILHFLAMPLAGAMIAFSIRQECGICDGGLENFILLLVSVFTAWMYSLISNNIADREIDSINNSNRPLFQGWTLDRYQKAGRLFLVLTLVLAAVVPFRSSFFVLVFLAGYHLYSQPPFRLKRIPVLSKIIIAFNTWVLALAGFTFGGHSPLQFPGRYTWLFLLCFGLALNFIDLKDREADQAGGIRTLPVLLGEKKGRWVTGLLVLASYAAAGLLINYLGVLLVCLAGGVFSLLAILRIKKSDPWIVSGYLVCLAAVMLIVKLPSLEALRQTLF